MVDVGHHNSYAHPTNTLIDCARRLSGLPVLFVGIRCALEIIMERRRRGQIGRENLYLEGVGSRTCAGSRARMAASSTYSRHLRS
ncbi:hypothetical protein [Mesorhizobium sp. B2-4-13]|uniref:phosphotransferase-like protein n=1 Tax=Mesorhizobium sp. B2-4-13 TaxID=2589936 RepID=UPI001FEF0B2F|nr:hypothetical protein [Mesorhizobium sp. B2-4-13]